MKGKILAFLLIWFLAMPLVGAQNQTVELPTPGILPDQPILYFLENLKEEIETFLTRDPASKAEKYLWRASERMVEAQAMVERNKPDLAEKALKRYEAQLKKALSQTEALSAKGLGLNVDALREKVAESTLKHQEVLMDVYEKAPDPAKEALKNAIEQSSRGHQQALDSITTAKREKVREALRAKEEQLREKRSRLNLPIPQGRENK